MRGRSSRVGCIGCWFDTYTDHVDGTDIAGVSGTEGRDAAAAHLPTPPATPRKRTAMSSSAAKTTVPASKRGRRSATDILASPSKKLKKAKASKSKR